jgi:uncharacterized coiled-coil protein SlyX
MNAPNQDAQTPHDRLLDRVVELEVLLTHLQRTLVDLDQVVLSQQKQIEGLERTVARLHTEFDVLANPSQEARSPEDEKPPHY